MIVTQEKGADDFLLADSPFMKKSETMYFGVSILCRCIKDYNIIKRIPGVKTIRRTTVTKTNWLSTSKATTGL